MRLIPSADASSRSEGRRCPGTNSPSAIAVTSRSAMCSPPVRSLTDSRIDMLGTDDISALPQDPRTSRG